MPAYTPTSAIELKDLVEGGRKALSLSVDGLADQAFARMVFNVCMANNDDHPKNHSFLLERGKGWRLAPAYDMMFACNPANKWTARHAMGVNGAFADIGRADVEAVAARCNVKEASACIERVVEVARNWKGYAEKAGVDEATANEVDAVIQSCCKPLSNRAAR